MNESLIAENIIKEYPTRGAPLSVLRGVSLRLEPGSSTAVMGPSGCGKSTLLAILGTLESPTSGRVTLADADPFALSEPDLAVFRNHKIGLVFQDHHLLPQCCVLENVLVPTWADSHSQNAEDRARKLLDRVGLSSHLDHLPSELSGGERQRVAIARALINRPNLLLADEPTGNLDRKASDSVAAMLLELQKEEQAILLVVTHSTELASRMDHRMSLVDGRLENS